MMKNFICLLGVIITLFQTEVYGQSTQDLVKKSTLYFTLDDKDSMTGDGAIFIKKKIAESQFVLIGEQHNIHQIEHFTKALIPFLKSNGYDSYVTEIGPSAALELKQLNQQKKTLEDFNKTYSKYAMYAPFGFFGTKEEGESLNQLNKYDVQLKGIDFENYSSYLFLLDKIYEHASKKKVSKQLYNTVRDSIISEYSKGKNGYNPNLTKNLLASNGLQVFLTQADNNKTRFLTEQFRRSLHINNEQTKGNWQLRVENMKTNFVELYKSFRQQNKLPKMFFKFGAVHTARGTSSSGFQEVGNTIYELSNINQTKSFSVIAFPRYVYNEKTDSIEDVIEKEEIEILEFTKSDTWTLINLKELFQLSIDNKVRLSKAINSYIEKYDAILIPPATKYSTKNY